MTVLYIFGYLETPYKIKKCIFGVYGWCVRFVADKYKLIIYNILHLSARFKPVVSFFDFIPKLKIL
jgi:hypothetical protein